MSKKGSSIKPRRLMLLLLIVVIALAVGSTGYFMFYNYTYSTLGITTKEVKLLEYGTKNYNLKNFIKNSNGSITSIKGAIDTNKIGKQKVDVVLNKYNVVKTVSFYVNVVDTVAPVISFKEDTITITEGEDYNLFENIVSVDDNVDGNLPFKSYEDVNLEKDKYYYTVSTNFDYHTSGSYSVDVRAVDKFKNVTTASFTIKVEKPQVVFREAPYVANPGVNNSGNSIANSAYSLLGSPYVAGGTSPAGFDCSGFVQYVYALNGISISRSSYTQAYDGVNISLESAQPGDIIVWGYGYGAVTHTAVYVGNGQMIHAANPSMGVILSSVSGWLNGSGTTILYVRRVAS